MKKNFKKLFFFVFFLSFFLINPILVLADSKTVTWNSVTIDKSWLVVDTGNPTDTVSGDGSGCLSTAKGGKKLVSFEKIGSLEKDGEKVAWKAKAVFEYDVLAYSKVLPENTVAGSLQKQQSKQWLLIRKFPSVNVYPPPQYNNLEKITGNIRYNDLDYGGQMYSHHYSGHIPIELNIKQDFAGRTFELNGYTIKNLKVYSEIRDVVVKGAETKNIAEYNDLFGDKENTKTDIGGVNVIDPDVGSGDKYKDVLKEMESLGMQSRTKLGEFTMSYGGRSGQSMTDVETVGTTWSDKESDDTISFNMKYTVKPEITVKKEEVKFKYGEINWDYEDVLFSASSVKLDYSQMRSFKRIESVHVYNKMVRNTFKVEVNFIAEGEMEGELGGDELEDPALDIGDFVWDPNFTGEGETTVTDYESINVSLITNIIMMVVVIAVIALIVYLLLKTLGVELIRQGFKRIFG